MLSIEVGKAEGGIKFDTTSAEKEKRRANKSPSREINAEDNLKNTTLNISKENGEL